MRSVSGKCNTKVMETLRRGRYGLGWEMIISKRSRGDGGAAEDVKLKVGEGRAFAPQTPKQGLERPVRTFDGLLLNPNWFRDASI